MFIWFFLGSKPYGDLSIEETKDYVCKQKGNLGIPSNFPSQLSDQLKLCWSYNPEDRPDFNALELTIKQFRNNLNNEEFINFENEQTEDNKINPIVMGTAQVNAQDKYQTLDKEQNKDNESKVHVNGTEMVTVSTYVFSNLQKNITKD